jgi:hypothetical protein
VAGTSAPPFLSHDGQDIVHENPEQKYLNANKIIEIQKKCDQLVQIISIVFDQVNQNVISLVERGHNWDHD